MTRPRGWAAEARDVALLGGVLFAVTLVPYLVAHLNAPPGKVFNGFFYIADDAATYVAKMRQGADGAWGWSDPYISSPVARPVGLFLFYILWGKVAALLHVSLLVGYHLARLSGALALVAAARMGAREWLPEGRVRPVGVALALLGSGFGYLVTALHQPAGLEALDLHLPELSGFYSILAIPHFAWAAALVVLALVALTRLAHSTGAPDAGRAGAAAAVALVLLTLIHPQMVFVLAALAGVQLLLERPAVERWALTALAFVPALPLLYYNYRLLIDDPVIRQWSEQWKHQAPGFASLLVALGLPLALTVVAVIARRWRGDRGAQLMVAWLVVVLALVYLPNPVNIQRRLLDGIYVPVAFLAALGVDALAGTSKRRWRRLVAGTLAVASLSSLVVWGIGLEWGASRAEPQVYVDAGVWRAIAWLGQQPRAGAAPAVLSAPDTGLLIPPYAGDRVYVGHYSETLSYATRVDLAEAALRGNTQTLWNFMMQEDVTYLFYGPTERALGAVRPRSDLFETVYDRDGVTIYRVAALA